MGHYVSLRSDHVPAFPPRAAPILAWGYRHLCWQGLRPLTMKTVPEPGFLLPLADHGRTTSSTREPGAVHHGQNIFRASRRSPAQEVRARDADEGVRLLASVRPAQVGDAVFRDHGDVARPHHRRALRRPRQDTRGLVAPGGRGQREDVPTVHRNHRGDVAVRAFDPGPALLEDVGIGRDEGGHQGWILLANPTGYLSSQRRVQISYSPMSYAW